MSDLKHELPREAASPRMPGFYRIAPSLEDVSGSQDRTRMPARMNGEVDPRTGRSGPSANRTRALWTERFLVALIVASLVATLNLLLVIHRRSRVNPVAAANTPKTTEDSAPRSASVPIQSDTVIRPTSPNNAQVADLPPAPGASQPAKPTPAPEDPTPKVVASLSAAAGREIDAGREADRHTVALEAAVRSVAAESQRWKRRELLVRQQIEGLNERAVRLEREATELDAERDVLESERDALKAALGKAAQRSGYAVLPYKGANGTWRRPVVLECTTGGVKLQPQGINFSSLELSPFIHPRASPFVQAIVRELRHIAMTDTPDGAPAIPYLVFLVRPEGIRHYYEARTRLESLGIAFGYELIDQDLVVSVPDFDDLTTWDGTVPLELPIERAPRTKPAVGSRLSSGAGQGDGSGNSATEPQRNQPLTSAGSFASGGAARGGRSNAGGTNAEDVSPNDFVWPGAGTQIGSAGGSTRSANALAGAGDPLAIGGEAGSSSNPVAAGTGGQFIQSGNRLFGGQGQAPTPGSLDTNGGLGGIAGSSGLFGSGSGSGLAAPGLGGAPVGGGSPGIGGSPGPAGAVPLGSQGLGPGTGAGTASSSISRVGPSGTLDVLPDLEPASDSAPASPARSVDGSSARQSLGANSAGGAGSQDIGLGTGAMGTAASPAAGGSPFSSRGGSRAASTATGPSGVLGPANGAATGTGSTASPPGGAGTQQGLNGGPSGPDSVTAETQGTSGLGADTGSRPRNLPGPPADTRVTGDDDSKSATSAVGSLPPLPPNLLPSTGAAGSQSGPSPAEPAGTAGASAAGPATNGFGAGQPTTAATASQAPPGTSGKVANAGSSPASVTGLPPSFSGDAPPNAASALSDWMPVSSASSSIESALSSPSSSSSSSSFGSPPSGSSSSSSSDSSSAPSSMTAAPFQPPGNPSSPSSSLSLGGATTPASDSSNDFIFPPASKPRPPFGSIEVPFEVVVVCRGHDVLIHPGGYRLTAQALAQRTTGGDNVLAREIRTVVQRRSVVDPMIRQRPSIRFLVEPDGADTFWAARRQLLFSLPDWPMSLQVAGPQAARVFSKETW
jgi:hypothetical protein